jgi:hypothetical protein
VNVCRSTIAFLEVRDAGKVVGGISAYPFILVSDTLNNPIRSWILNRSWMLMRMTVEEMRDSLGLFILCI